ncbi:MAG: D-aminoacyl-tRNA deacylase [Nitrososphaerales archaeon]
MKPVIVCSLNDPAGTNIRERLIENFNFNEIMDCFDSYPIYENDESYLACSHKEVIRIDDIESKFGISEYYFVSRHWAESGIPSLTAHFTGNFGANDFGGNPGEVSVFSPSMLKNYFLQLNKMRDTLSAQYHITLEATHHGPTSLKSPSLFVELGSTNEQWSDTGAARIVADALMRSLVSKTKYSKCAIAVGGMHYSEKFNTLLLNSDIAIGPIIPKYALEYFSSELIFQIIEKSKEPINLAVVDMKGLGRFKEKVLDVLRIHGLEMLRA